MNKNELTSLMAEIESLKAQNAALMAKKNGKLSFKVSEKGAVSVYGVGRFPVTLYREQWERLLAVSAELTQFITDNAGGLATKDNPKLIGTESPKGMVTALGTTVRFGASKLKPANAGQRVDMSVQH